MTFRFAPALGWRDKKKKKKISTYSMIHHNKVLGKEGAEGRGPGDVIGGGVGVIRESERKKKWRRRSRRRKRRRK